MIGTLRAVLTRPDPFFEHRDTDPSLLYPTVIVASIGVLGVLAIIPAFLVMGRGMPEEIWPFLAALAVGALLFAFAGPFITWLLYAIAFQVISLVFGGDGSFRKTFILSGWGFLPQVISSALALVATIIVLQWRSLPAASGMQALEVYTQQVQNDPLLQAVSLIGIGMTLWSGYIWLFAVKHARNLSRNHALVTVAIPVAISIGFSIFSLVYM